MNRISAALATATLLALAGCGGSGTPTGSASSTADWFARILGSASLVLSVVVAGRQAWFHWHLSRDRQAWPLLEPLRTLCEGAKWVAAGTIQPSGFLADRYDGPLKQVRAQTGGLKDK